MPNETYLNEKNLLDNEEIEEMASIGKYLAYTIMVFVVAFLILVYTNESFLDKFIDWTLKIVYAVVGGAVIYVIVRLTIGKKR